MGDGAEADEPTTRFIEHFAGELVAAGMPPMASRLFAALLASDDGSLTAARAGEVLHASPAAISGAAGYLQQASLVRRERVPGSRRHRFCVDGSTWYESLVHRQQLLDRWVEVLDKGVAAVGPATPAGARLGESRDFIDFLRGEMPALLERWREHHRSPV